ncbi:hypothetical protein HMPREF0239_02242 [Clostridium sp. ATCC BAA-442]|jgi:hypothetical protein|nr:hypothetical protein HMPREF0239_02242 [Clostridium sp. ATCC BAA-442]
MTARPIRRNAQTPDRNGKIFYTSTTSLSHISKGCPPEALLLRKMLHLSLDEVIGSSVKQQLLGMKKIMLNCINDYN